MSNGLSLLARPYVIPSRMGCPTPWSHSGVPAGSHLWMGQHPPAASTPSVGPWGFSSFDPLTGSQGSGCFPAGLPPYPRTPPPPNSPVAPVLSRGSSSYCPPEGRLTPAAQPPGLQWGDPPEELPTGRGAKPPIRMGLQVEHLGPCPVLQPRTLPSAPFPQSRPSA